MQLRDAEHRRVVNLRCCVVERHRRAHRSRGARGSVLELHTPGRVRRGRAWGKDEVFYGDALVRPGRHNATMLKIQ